MLGKTNVKIKPNAKKPLIDYVEYIESTGTQWIDTGYAVKNGDTVEICFQATSVPSSGESWVYATWGSDPAYFRCGFSNSAFDTSRGFTYSQTTDKTAKTIGIGKSTVDTTLTAYLFSQHESNGAVHTANSKYKLYYCKIYNSGGSLVHDFRPCKDANGIYCLYDEVSQSYFYNKGTGEFLGGASTNPAIILANAKLLMHFNDSLYDATGKSTPTIYGTEQYKAGKFDNAIYIDRASCVKIPLTEELTLGENDFTIAGWYYHDDVYLNGCLFSFVHYVDSSYGWQGVQAWLAQSGGNIRFCCDTASNVKNRLDTSTNLKSTTWYHIALVRHGSTVTLYVDGQSVGSLTVSGSVYQNANAIWRIGATNGRSSSTTSTGLSEAWTGLIDEVIIVNGLAVWTENFTPPEKPYSEVVI